MRKCIHCSHEGPDDEFTAYRDRKTRERRYYNVCRECTRLRNAERQAQYRERNLEKVRERQRVDKYVRYNTDPEFRERCLAQRRKS